MTLVTHNIKCALLFELGMPFHIEATFLRAACRIGEGVGGARNDFHIDAFTILDVYGGTAVNRCRVSQCEAV